MSNLSEPPVVARAATRRSRRVSVIWVIPLVAVAIGAWLAWDTLSKEGPTITVTFDSAEGLQPGQSQLKFKDIVFGTVKSLELAPDHTHVVVTIATTRQAEPLLTDKTVFWVVKPRLFAGVDLRSRNPAVGELCRHDAGRHRRQAAARVRRARGPADPQRACPGPRLFAEGQAARLDLARLADLLPRSERRRGARLGHRRHGRIRDDPRLCPRALRQLCP